MQLGELQEHLKEFNDLGADVWAVDSTEPAAKAARYAELRGITFPLLADEGLAVTKSYGVVNAARPEMAYPATFVTDRDGVVRYARVDLDFTNRPPVSDLLAAVKALPK
ncbi:MAG TPA: redoxin domain-containing protein [Thermoanaerobaculaceae bacterium]|nr:redoxin domain-containing protein [Thermoanaerobaculaceae bacterium]